MVAEAKHKSIQGQGLKTLTPRQMLERLPISSAQLKAGNTFENLLNQTRQIIYSLHQAKAITKIVYNNIIVLIKQNGYFIYQFWKQKNI